MLPSLPFANYRTRTPLVERRIIKVADSIAGKRIDFVGLQATNY